MSLPRMVVLVFGVVYVLVGVIGFIPGLTTQGGTAGMQTATGAILGIFPINALHNIVHLVIGAALLYGATSTGAAVLVARIVGAVYIVVGVLGFIDPNSFNLMPIGGTDIGLHLASGAILLAASFLGGDATETRRAT